MSPRAPACPTPRRFIGRSSPRRLERTPSISTAGRILDTPDTWSDSPGHPSVVPSGLVRHTECFPALKRRMSLARPLCERTERDVHVASAWHRHADFTEKPMPVDLRALQTPKPAGRGGLQCLCWRLASRLQLRAKQITPLKRSGPHPCPRPVPHLGRRGAES